MNHEGGCLPCLDGAVDSQTAKLDLCSGSSSCRPLPSSLTSVAHRRRCKTQFAAPASGKREYHPTRMAPCSVARYLYFYRLCMLCYSHQSSPTPRIQASTQWCTLTRIIVPAAPAEGQITSRSWEICERPQQHWKICEATLHQAIVDEGSLDEPAFPRLLSAFAASESEGGQHTGQVSPQPSPTLATAPAMIHPCPSSGVLGNLQTPGKGPVLKRNPGNRLHQSESSHPGPAKGLCLQITFHARSSAHSFWKLLAQDQPDRRAKRGPEECTGERCDMTECPTKNKGATLHNAFLFCTCFCLWRYLALLALDSSAVWVK
jgi:hypothetical protein